MSALLPDQETLASQHLPSAADGAPRVLMDTQHLLDISFDRLKSQLHIRAPAGTVTATVGAGMELKFVVKEFRDLADMIEDLSKT